MLKELGGLLLTAVFVVLIVIAAPAAVAGILYFGVPYVTGFDELGYWQYFVGIILVFVVARFVLGIGTSVNIERGCEE